ncbi:hypothetical protein [Nocardia sp. NPDC056100]|uniref:hypothetical protein n=1 Tax=Nocardia sp. NPDC056100 TaxID=3345712 RepID=UPI0035DEFD26
MDSGKDTSADRPASGAGAGAPDPGTEHDALTEAHRRPPAEQPDDDSGFGPPVSEFGPSLNDFGPPISVFGSAGEGFGAPSADFGAPAADFGAGEFGPPTGEYPVVPEASASGWTPAPAPASPELAWRPADDGAVTPGVAPEYLAPDSGTPYSGDPNALYGNDFDGSEQTVRHATTPEPPKRSSGWATGGGIKTSQIGRESAWLRSAENGMPPADSAAPQQESLSWADDPLTKMLMPKKAEPGKGGAKKESLSWGDDEIAKRLAPKAAAPQRKSKKPWMPIAVGAGAVVLIAVVALVVVSLTGGEDKAPEPEAVFGPGGTVTTAAPTSVAALSCPAKREGPLTIGNGAGGTDTGANAILGFQHAFYADRDGNKARSFVAPDALNVSPADTIQKAINDVIPKGTSYCLRITDVSTEDGIRDGNNAYDADLTEHRTDGTTTVYRQRIGTVTRDGKHLIFAIDER